MSDLPRKSEVKILTIIDPQFGERCSLCPQVIATDVHVVMCQECKHWIHFSCAQVDMSVTGRNFVCVLCNLDDTKSTSAISVCTTTSSTKARAALQLRRLEEEKEIQERLLKERHEMNKRLQDKANQEEREREFQVLQEKARLESDFLDKKYAVLEEGASISGGKSVRSGRTGISNRSLPSSVGQWLANQTQEEGAVGGINTVTSTSSNGTVPKLPTSKATADALTNVTAVPRIPSYEFPPTSTSLVPKLEAVTSPSTITQENLEARKQQIQQQLDEYLALLDCFQQQKPNNPATEKLSDVNTAAKAPALAPVVAVTAAASSSQQLPPAPAPFTAVTAAASSSHQLPPAPAPFAAVTAAVSLSQQLPPAPAPFAAVTAAASSSHQLPPAPAPFAAVTAAASSNHQLPPAPAPFAAVTAAASSSQQFPPASAPFAAVTAAASSSHQLPPAPAPFAAVTAAASSSQQFPPASAPFTAVTAAASSSHQLPPAPAPFAAVTAAASIPPPTSLRFSAPLLDFMTTSHGSAPISNGYSPFLTTSPAVTLPSLSGGVHSLTRGFTIPDVTSVSSHQGSITTPVVTQVPPSGTQGFVYGPNSQQLAARHVVPKELPKFSGDPLDWPVFYSSYCNSTQMCGFSEAENLMRLERCLIGRAREMVHSCLLHPSLVPQLLATLYTLYGRPELIVNCLLDKVRATPAPKAERLESLIGFGLAVQNMCAQLMSLGLESHLCNPTLLSELEAKLPAGVALDWALHQRHLKTVDLRTFGDYMSTIVVAASKVVPYGSTSLKFEKLKPKDKAYINTHSRDEGYDQSAEKGTETGNNPVAHPRTCLMCKKVGHRLKDCRVFSGLELAERWRQIQETNICRRCLSGHGKWPCKATVCGFEGCEGRHHKLLHPGNPQLPAKNEESSTNPATLAVHRSGRSTLFRVLPIMLHGPETSVEALAFLDDGSGLTLVEADLVRQLGITGETNPLCLQWTSNITRSEADSQRVDLNISNASGKKFKLEGAQTVSSLNLPRQSLDFKGMAKKYPHLQNLPVKSYQNELPRVLIGLDNTHLLTTLKRREGQPQEPVATKTRLGWTIYGSVEGWHESQTHRLLHICAEQTDQDLHDAVNDFFSLENVGVAAVPNLESSEDRRARDIMLETTKRTPSGRFETGLLWRFDNFEFPDSRPMAERRLKCLERRLSTKPELYANVKQQIIDYQTKGYAHKATEDELSSADPRRVWYLPLGVVLNPNKPGKVRLVWDAAAKVRGVSLNSMLLKGPDLLIPLFAALFRFRQFQFAVTADIKEMFHQVLIRPQDRSAQRFLFRDDPAKPMDTYVMDVATFGATCSPSSVQNVKNLNAKEWSLEYPEAAKAITDGHYMDDYLDSLHTENETVQLAQEVKALHAKAGFELRNWLSNSEAVLRRVGEPGTQMPKNFFDDKVNGSERVLGMIWVPREDVFTFKGKFQGALLPLISGQVVPTKREALRLVMSIFDPHGLVANVVVHGKVLLQDMWREKIGWDEKISSELFDKWQRWVKEVRNLDKVKIPRCYFSGYSAKSLKTLEMHTFVDASETACAATVYFRIVDRGQVRCILVAAKTKVAPLKALTVPRLEIQAGVLGTRLMRAVKEHHSLNIRSRTIHTDSSTALSWIQSDQRRYSRFVAFRVSEILNDSEISEWRWVPSRMNVADDATKWGTGPNLSSNGRWFRGPAFLYEAEADWPCAPLPPPNTQEEQRASFLHHRVSLGPMIKYERFSDWRKLLKAMAYVLRFVKRYRTKCVVENRGIVSREELQQAELVVLKAVQLEVYPDEVVTLERDDPNLQVEKSSQIWKLTPFIDEFGLLRMDGRVGAASVPYDAKYPIILPKSHHVTELLLTRYHQRFGHGNGETVVNEVRQKFCISNLRSMVQKTARKCQWCKVYKASPSAPRMAPLPVARLTSHVRPFTFAGVDLCGPFLIRHGRSLVKRWVMLFTCLTVRAIHLEIVYTLSAESCKLGFRRFIALRGSPQEIYSDCGTNFQGLSNELKAEIAAIDQELATTFTNTNTKWHFNPPAAPHMGGVWERMVRSVKTALSTISTCRNPDGETFETFLAEAMAIVNSRPLTHVPLQAVDEEALTPNHFLMLSSTGVSQPTQPTTDLQSSLRSNWNHLQFLLDHYWARWIKEYLPAINQRRKWFAESRPISVGDLVMVVNEGIRNSWTRGRVVAVLPGKDGRIRSARVQTSAGVLTRPVVRLALLEVRNGGTAGPGDQQYGSGIVAEADDHTSKPPGELDRSLISPPGQNVSALMTQPKKGETVKN